MKKLLIAIIAAVLAFSLFCGASAEVMNLGYGWNPIIVNPDLIKAIQNTETITRYFNDNTVCVAGWSLRQMDPKLTDRWYTVIPIDLTANGTTTLQLVASNMYYFGYAYVTVLDGRVWVRFDYPNGHMKVREECVAIFTSMDEITTEYLEHPVGNLVPGHSLSIADQLDGAELGLLFIRNLVDYRQPFYGGSGWLKRWWRNSPEWREYRNDRQWAMDYFLLNRSYD